MKNRQFLLLMAVLVAILCAAVFLLSCNTAKKDFNNVNKAIIRHEAQTAKQVAKRWPRIVTNTVHDSTSFKKSLDSTKQLNDFYKTLLENMEPIIQHDTIIPQCADYADNELKLQNIIFIKDNQIADLNQQIKNIKPIHDIDSVRDPRAEAELTGKLQLAENNYQKQIEITQKQQHKLDKKDTFLWWLIGLLGASLIIHFLRSRFKIPIKI